MRLHWLRPGRLALAVALCAGAAGMAQAGDSEIGAVFLRDYTGAVGQRTGGETRELFYNLPVYSNETVQTGAGASTALTFLDDTRLQVGPSSTILLDRFVFDPDRKVGDVAISFGKGIFRFVSGNIQNKDGIALRTPSASIAIRGTTLIVYVGADNSTIVSVLDGAIEMRPCGGPVQTAVAGESVQAAGDCSGSSRTGGRAAPRDPAVDEDAGGFGGDPGGDSGTDRDKDSGGRKN